MRRQQAPTERDSVEFHPHPILTGEAHSPILDASALRSTVEHYQPLIDYTQKALRAWRLWDRILKYSEVGDYAMHPDYGQFTQCREARNTLAQQLWDQRKILSRLIKQGVIERVVRGVFIKQHKASLEERVPSLFKIVQVLIQKTGEQIARQGAEAARQLALTTQVPIKLVFYTSGNSRVVRVENQTVYLKHVNPSQLILAGTIAGMLISALRYLGQTQVTTQTIEVLKVRLSSQKFQEVLQATQYMPAWMSDVLYRYHKQK